MKQTGESQYITLPPDDELYTAEHFVLSLMRTLHRFHCLLLITASNFKLFQYEYIIVSHALHSKNCVCTDPLYYHSINRYLWINCAVYGIINVSTDNCSINSMFITA